jgi:uncharacterized protein (TIGR02444 family)
MQDTRGQSLWEFSVALYAHEPVKAAALALQDAGLDVNLAFWIVWSVQAGRDPLPVLDDAIQVTADWHGLATGPLRAVRDDLKQAPDFVPREAALALRRAVLDAELDAERIAQSVLAQLDAPGLVQGGTGPEAVISRLEHYAARAAPDAPVRAFTQAVFSASKKE